VSPVELSLLTGEERGRGRRQISRRRESLIPYKSFNSLWLHYGEVPLGAELIVVRKRANGNMPGGNLKQNKLLYQHLMTGKYFIHIFLQKS